jgi:YD repeat-containing protein
VRYLRLAGLTFLALMMAALGGLAYAQGTTQYIYDANGRLTGVIAPNGEAAIYHYDPAGNLTSIEDVGAGGFAILSFSPGVGTIGDQVTIVGVGLDTASAVSFNGTPAQIVSATPGSLVTAVPNGASTGLITLSGVRGSASTATAFTVVARIVITPPLAEILPGESISFSATVVGTPDQRVTWDVNGISGGNAGVGTISASGFYQSPSVNTGLTVTVDATSVADTSVVSHATIRILNPNTSSEVRSAAVSVGLGLTANFAAAPLSVQVGAPLGIESHSVSVLEGNFVFAGSAAVSVDVGETLAITSQPVSAELGALFPASATPVSATTGPVIGAISPGTLRRGTTVTVTMTGQNLGGTTAVAFNTRNSNLERNITVSNISVSSDGTTLMFTAAVSTSAAPGADVVFVTTPNGFSQTQSIGTNTIAIQ